MRKRCITLVKRRRGHLPPIRFRIAKPFRIPQPVPLFIADIEVAERIVELTLMERTTVVALNANNASSISV